MSTTQKSPEMAIKIKINPETLRLEGYNTFVKGTVCSKQGSDDSCSFESELTEFCEDDRKSIEEWVGNVHSVTFSINLDHPLIIPEHEHDISNLSLFLKKCWVGLSDGTDMPCFVCWHRLMPKHLNPNRIVLLSYKTDLLKEKDPVDVAFAGAKLVPAVSF